MSEERGDLILNMLRAIRAEQAAQREKLDGMPGTRLHKAGHDRKGIDASLPRGRK